MTTSLTRRSSAPRKEALQKLPPGGRASLEALIYLAGTLAVVALVTSFGWVNLKSRNLSSEPLVVWKTAEPKLLQEAMRVGFIPDFGASPGEQRSLAEGVPCSQLGESWFWAMPDLSDDSMRRREPPYPLACDWTPGAQEIIVINR